MGNASKGQLWKFELCDTSATSNAKWWNFELLPESLVWHPIIWSLILTQHKTSSELLSCQIFLDHFSELHPPHKIKIIPISQSPVQFSLKKQSQHWVARSSLLRNTLFCQLTPKVVSAEEMLICKKLLFLSHTLVNIFEWPAEAWRDNITKRNLIKILPLFVQQIHSNNL